MAGADRAECELSLGFLWHHIKENRIVFCLFLKPCFFLKKSNFYKAGRTRNDFSPPTKSLRVRHQFLRDFSRPTEIGQYQTVLILHRHVNRLKSAN